MHQQIISLNKNKILSQLTIIKTIIGDEEWKDQLFVHDTGIENIELPTFWWKFVFFFKIVFKKDKAYI